MSKIVKCLVLVVCLCFCCVSFAIAENIGSPVMVKMGDNVWEVKVTNYVEKPFTSSEKRVDVSLSYFNASPNSKVQKIDPDDWTYYLIGRDNSSYKVKAYKRDPGSAFWTSSEDILVGGVFNAKICFSLPKPVPVKQFTIVGEVAIPSQVNVEIPASLTTTQASIPLSPTESISGGASYTSSPTYVASNVSSNPQNTYNGIESDAQAGFGVMVGHIIGLSGIYWPNNMGLPLGGQVIVAKTSNVDSLSFNARVHLKLFAVPFGRISIAPQVGYQFSVSGNVSKSTYGLVGVAEFIMPFPTTVAGGKKLIQREDMWLSFLSFERVKAVGLSGEIGYYGQGIRSIDLSNPDKLTHGFSMAAHVYL